MTKIDHLYRVNQTLNIIHQNLAGDCSAKTLAAHAAFSEHYFHRVFKKTTGEPIHQYVRRTRLETAANHLIFSPELTVQQIAVSCGFHSLSSFTRAFKTVFSSTPGQWRMNKAFSDEHHYLSDPLIKSAYQRLANTKLPTPNIVQLSPKTVAYLRHKGYGRDIAETWTSLRNWAVSEHRLTDEQIGVHHSNPAIVPLQDCHYVACLGIETDIARRGRISSATIPGGLHAAFELKGQYGELLPYISKIHGDWLPKSDFVIKTTPSFAKYKTNQFLSDDDLFELTFYLPIESA